MTEFKFVIVKIFRSYSNCNSVILIRSCELASKNCVGRYALVFLRKNERSMLSKNGAYQPCSYNWHYFQTTPLNRRLKLQKFKQLFELFRVLFSLT